jgi:hypothetical protein
MLAIDVPISVMAGLVLSEAGRRILQGDDPHEHNSLRKTVLIFSLFFITPIPFYFFLGWPAWETNFLWGWPDHVLDSPVRAAGVAFGIFILTVGPAYAAFELGRWLIRKGKARVVRVLYVAMLALVGVIVFLTRRITFNIASTYAKYEAGEFYSFWSQPFFTGWLVVTIYFYGALAVFYILIRKKGESRA